SFWGTDDGVLLPSYRWSGEPTVARGGDGRLWFQAANGVAVLDPASLQDSQPSVRVGIDRAIADGRLLPVSGAAVETSPRTGRLQIDYSALSLAGASKVRFSYRLDGIDSRWIESRGVQNAVYERLPPGRYRFRVRGTIDGVEAASAFMDVAVPAAFYETGWFYGSCV